MRNVIVIDVRTQCACDAVVTCGTKTNEIIIELNVGNVSSPQFEIYKEDTLIETIDLVPSTTNTITLLYDYWTLGGTSKIRYKDSNRTGTTFEIVFPETVSDISLTKSSSTTFTVKSYVEESDALTVNDIINNLTSVDINKALSAYQGNVLDGKISDVEGTVTDQTSALNGKINNLVDRGYSLIRSEDINILTTTETIYDTFQNRKISDYDLIIITIGATTTDIRATMTLPRTIFNNATIPQKLYIDCWSNFGQNYHVVCVKCVNDTQISAYIANGAMKYLNIYGMKHMDIRYT